MGNQFYLESNDVSAIKSGLDKLGFYTKGRTLQRRKRGKLGGNTTTSGGNTFQVIRGTVDSVETIVIPATDYIPEKTYRYCKIKDRTGIKAYEENAKAPAEDLVKVTFDDDAIPSIGDEIWAIYHAGILVVPPPTENDVEITIDWFKLINEDINIVLIDKDIKVNDDPPPDALGITEDDPSTLLDSEHVLLTEEEHSRGMEVVFQDPIPDDPTDYDSHNVDSLNLWGYERVQIDLKYYRNAVNHILNEGSVQILHTDSNHLQLEEGASIVNGYYVDAKVTITDGPGEGEVFNILSYNGESLTITIDGTWAVEPDLLSSYEITKSDPGWVEDKPKLILVTTSVTDNSDIDYPIKVIRYATIPVFYDDGNPFVVGEYIRSDYPEYPEDEFFPPDGDGTFEVTPEDYFKKKYRGIVFKGVLITALCKELPPPPLTEIVA